MSPLPVPPLAESCLRRRPGGWPFSLTEAIRSAAFVWRRGQVNSVLRQFARLRTPEGSHWRSARGYCTWAVALAMGAQVCGCLDFGESSTRWVPFSLPDDILRRRGKSIDDLLIDGNRLIAVDNIATPHQLIVYDVTNPRQPRLVDVSGEIMGVNMEIDHGTMGTSVLALLTHSFTYGGANRAIILLDRVSLKEFGRLWVPDANSGYHRFVDESTEKRAWFHLSFLGDMLLIAAGEDGIGLLDSSTVPRPGLSRISHEGLLAHLLTRPSPSDPPDVIEAYGERDESFRQRTEATEAFERQAKASIIYQSLPVAMSGQAVRVFPVPETRQAVAVVHTSGRFQAFLLV